MTPAELRDLADQIDADDHIGPMARLLVGAVLRGRAARMERGEA